MAVLWIDGFEHGRAGSGLVNVHDVSQGGNTVGTTNVRTGLRSWECIHTGVTRNAGMNVPAGHRVVGMSFYVYLTVFPPSSSSSIAFFNNATANGSLSYNVPTGKFQVGVAGGTFLDLGPTVALNTWYLVDLLFDSSGTTYSVKGRIDGGTEVEATRTGLAAADITAARLGTPGASGANYSMYCDDWIITTGSGEYPLGEHSVVSLIPSADGAHNIFTAGDFDSNTSVAFSNATTDGWSYIAHRPLQVANTPEQTIRQDTNGATRYMEFLFENLPAGTDDVLAVRTYGGHVESSASGATLAQMKLMLADSTEVLTTGALSMIHSTEDPGTTAQLKKRMAVDPAGGWDRTKVDGLKVRVGYKSATPILGMFDAMVEVLLVPSGAAPTDLVVADGQHAHAADSPTLTQVHALAVADAQHAHASDPVGVLAQTGPVAPADARSLHAAEVPTLVQNSSLVVADARSLHAGDNVSTSTSSSVGPADGRSGHAADSPTLTQLHLLAPADARHTPHAADSVPITKESALVVADARSTHSSDPVALVVVLAPADARHATHAADSPTLVQNSSLVVADARSLHAGDNVGLSAAGQLAPADARSTHAAEVPTLVQQHALAPADARSTSSADSPTLAQLHLLVVADARHLQAADNVATSGAGSVGPADARHGHAADPVALVQAHALAVADARSTHAADGLGVLAQAATLLVADARHLVASDPVALTGAQLLVVADARHAHAAESPYVAEPLPPPTLAGTRPDVEWVVVDLLAPVLGVDVVSAAFNPEEEHELPAVVVHRAGGGPRGVPPILDAALVGIDVYAESKVEAWDLMAEALETLAAAAGMAVGSPPHAWVAAVEDAGGTAWLPDETTGRARYSAVVRIHARGGSPELLALDGSPLPVDLVGSRVDAERIVVEFLVGGLGPDVAVGAFNPVEEVPLPAVLVHRAGGGTSGWPPVLDAALVGLDVFAETKPDAWDLCAEVLEVLSSSAGEAGDAWVSGVEDAGTTLWLTDPPRYSAVVRVYARAVSAVPA